MFSSSLWFPSSGTWSWEWTRCSSWCSSWWPSSTSTSLTSAPRMRHSGTKDPSNLQRWPWFHLQEPDPQHCHCQPGLRHRQLPIGVHHPHALLFNLPQTQWKIGYFWQLFKVLYLDSLPCCKNSGCCSKWSTSTTCAPMRTWFLKIPKSCQHRSEIYKIFWTCVSTLSIYSYI